MSTINLRALLTYCRTRVKRVRDLFGREQHAERGGCATAQRHGLLQPGCGARNALSGCAFALGGPAADNVAAPHGLPKKRTRRALKSRTGIELNGETAGKG